MKLDRDSGTLSATACRFEAAWRPIWPHQIFAAQDASRDAVESMLDESKHFIEWTATEAEVQTAAQLVELQVQLARWQLTWANTWNNPLQRKQLAEQSAAWSKRILEMSGLLRA
jgi:hypothetical protein